MDSTIESNGLRKAAILMVMLGEDTATKIYHNLAEQDLQSLTQEIAELEYIAPEMALRVLEEYYRLSMTQDCLVQGGSDYARKLLVASFGEEAATRGRIAFECRDSGGAHENRGGGRGVLWLRQVLAA